MGEQLTFSVSGYSSRGFHLYIDKWVPKPGQRLTCRLHVSGRIDIIKDEETVGTVCAEAPNDFKDWLRNDGHMKAIVVDIPRQLPTKGQEVPVIFVFIGENNSLMTNIMKAIKTGVLKKKRRKKSVNFEDGDITKNMEFEQFGDESQLGLSIVGMTMRGFHHYRKDWVPEKGDRFRCSLSETKYVQVLNNQGNTIGTVQTEGQKLFKMFVDADGVITAVVDGDPKKHRTKGLEVPVTFVFNGDWSNRLQNIRYKIIKDMTKKGKRKKSLKVLPGDVTKREINEQPTSSDESESGETVPKKMNEPPTSSDESESGETVTKKTKKPRKRRSDESESEETVSKKMKKPRKRRSDESESEETVSKKMKKPRKRRSDESESGGNSIEKKGKMKRTRILRSDDTIFLSEKYLSRISQQIGSNWKLFGIELGFSHVETQRFEDNNRGDMTTQICNMLVAWKKRNADAATLCNLQRAMKQCPSVHFQQPQLNEIFTEIRKKHKKTTK